MLAKQPRKSVEVRFTYCTDAPNSKPWEDYEIHGTEITSKIKLRRGTGNVEDLCLHRVLRTVSSTAAKNARNEGRRN